MVNARPSPLCQNRSASPAFALLSLSLRVVHVPVAGKIAAKEPARPQNERGARLNSVGTPSQGESGVNQSSCR